MVVVRTVPGYLGEQLFEDVHGPDEHFDLVDQHYRRAVVGLVFLRDQIVSFAHCCVQGERLLPKGCVDRVHEAYDLIRRAANGLGLKSLSPFLEYLRSSWSPKRIQRAEPLPAHRLVGHGEVVVSKNGVQGRWPRILRLVWFA